MANSVFMFQTVDECSIQPPAGSHRFLLYTFLQRFSPRGETWDVLTPAEVSVSVSF